MKEKQDIKYDTNSFDEKEFVFVWFKQLVKVDPKMPGHEHKYLEDLQQVVSLFHMYAAL